MTSQGRIIKSDKLNSIADSQREIESAVSQAESIRKKAAEEAFEEGVARAAAVLVAADRIKAETLRKSEGEILSAAVEIAGSIVRREIELDPDLAGEMIDRAIGMIVQKSTLRVRINPEDVSFAESIRKKRKHKYESMKIIPDMGVERGGCIVESGIGTIDARLESILQKIKEELSV